MKSKNAKYYPYLGVLTEAEGPITTSYNGSSPWKNTNTSFNWINFEYPLYHGHCDWEILIVLNDSIINRINNEEKLLSSGTACLIGPKDTHALYFPNRIKNQFQGVSLLAKDSYMRQLFSIYSPTLYDTICADAKPQYFTLTQIFLENLTNELLEIQTLPNKNTAYTEEQCNILFNSVILKYLKQNKEPSNIQEDLLFFIKSLNNPSLTKKEIKEEQDKLPYSYSHLTRLFKKHTGCTITQYVNNVKLQYAKELLATTDMTMLKIANALDFDSLSHFTHLFKKQFDITPSEYKKQNG